MSSLLLLCLSLALAPLSFGIAAFFSLIYPSINSLRRGKARKQDRQRTVLINGARMQKSLAACRAFGRQGWRVILVEEQGWGNLASAGFSSSVSKYRLVPPSNLPPKDGAKQTPYVEAMLQVAKQEKVDLFFPCSGAGSTGQDAIFADLLLSQTGGRVRSIIQSPAFVETLHEKDKFIELLGSLELPAPRSDIVYSVEEALDMLRSSGYPRCILKCAAELDDIGRADLTTYPLLGSDSQPDWHRTEQRLRNLSIPLCQKTPYILQEFIGDRDDAHRATEWCTHATVIDGTVTAFVCCPSNDMLMTYHPASRTHIGKLALEWTLLFLERLDRLSQQPDSPWPLSRLVGQGAPEGAGITGAFSMDFIHQPATGDGSSPERLVAIECNPRVHTAICLLTGSKHLANALAPAELRAEANDTHLPLTEQGATADLDLFSLKPQQVGVVDRFHRAKRLIRTAYLDGGNLSKSWIGHDLPARILPALLPSWLDSLMRRIHPLWRSYGALSKNDEAAVIVVSRPDDSSGPTNLGAEINGTTKQRRVVFDLHASAMFPPLTDPSFAKDDPWPFFALYHLQWPQLLLWQWRVKGTKWSRINVSTARIFEC